MRIVGIDFRDGILFVPEVLLAANAMKAGMVILRPLLAETGAPKIGKMVIGTVKGDIHDIGKNLVSMMMEGAGFEVIDLGINNPVEKYLDGDRGAPARHPRHVGAADHDHALHEGRHRHAEGEGHPQRLHRAGRRRAAERGLRQGGRRRRLLPRRRRRGRDGQVAARAPQGSAHARQNCGPDERGWRYGARRSRRALVIACGALAREILAVDARRTASAISTSPACRPTCTTGPRRSPRRCAARSAPLAAATTQILCLYGDCGTGGELDRVLAEEGVERIDGAALLRLLRRARRPSTRCTEEEPGTFYLTDFLVRHFERLIDRGPRPRPPPGAAAATISATTAASSISAQLPDPALDRKAEAAASRLGLPLVIRRTGLGGIEGFLTASRTAQADAFASNEAEMRPRNQ